MGHKLYDVLGVARDCSADDLKKAYKKLAIQHHPDKGGDPEKFKEISNAYQILSDDEQRSRYDQLGDERFDQSGNMSSVDPSVIFEQFFGRGGGFDPFSHLFGGGNPFGHHQQGSRKCRTVQHCIQISNREAYFGSEKHIKLTLHKKCLKCLDTCPTCQGRGQISEMQRMGPFTSMMSRPCHTCRGSGNIPKGKASCQECKGKGEFEEEKRIDIKIPMGVETGHQINIAGCGEQPQQQGDIAGDLIFEILVQLDSNFERKGLDLIYKTSISFKESVLGKVIQIPHYEELIHCNLSEYGIIQPGKEYIIPDKGMKTDTRKGKLIVILNINYPTKKLNESQKELFHKAFLNYDSCI
jgi:DnaJ homolog subfamily A member 2